MRGIEIKFSFAFFFVVFVIFVVKALLCATGSLALGNVAA